MGFIKEFKEFAMKGNVLDMAVGVIIGGAFGKIVSSLVDDILMPLVGMVTGNVDFTKLEVAFGEGDLAAEDNIVVTFTREEGEDAGSYAVTPVASSGNFEIEIVPGTLTSANSKQEIAQVFLSDFLFIRGTRCEVRGTDYLSDDVFLSSHDVDTSGQSLERPGSAAHPASRQREHIYRLDEAHRRNGRQRWVGQRLDILLQVVLQH